MRKDIEKVLKRYGLKDNPYQFVISENQSGGQNAYTITNNYASNSHVVNGNNFGINGDYHEKPPQRIATQKLIDSILTYMPSDTSIKIKFMYQPQDYEAKKYANSIAESLFKIGYSRFYLGTGMFLNSTNPHKLTINNQEGFYIIGIPSNPY